MINNTLQTIKNPELKFKKIALLICPTGTYCREDRCQSYFKFSLIPSMRAPLEECEIAGAISSLNGKSIIIDAPAENLSKEEFIKRVVNFNPDLIILSVTFGTLLDDLGHAKTLKNIFTKNIKIGLRGAPSYTNAKSILLKNNVVDFCLKGDYELAIKNILNNGIYSENGCIYRDQNGKIIENENLNYARNLDDLPLPNRKSIKKNLYTVRGTKKPQATIHVQRGCPFPCSYCLVHTVSGSKARHRSPENIAQEINSLIKDGVNHFYFRAETFSLNKKWVLALCKLLLKETPNIRWVTTTRVELIDEEIIKAMKLAGCYGISFGIDVASKTIAKKVNKFVEPEIIKKAMRLCDKHSVISLAYIMIGFIWDTKETIKEAEKLMLEIRPDLITIHFAHPYPGTKYYNDVKKINLKVLSKKAQSEPAHATNSLSLKFLNKSEKKILVKHYFRASTLMSLLKKTVLNYIQDRKN